MQAAGRFPLADDAFIRLRDQLANFCGVHLDASRQHGLEQALAYRMQAIRTDFASYERRLQIDREELRYLAELVVNHETTFFRNQPHMRALREVLLPELHRNKAPGEPIRIWSAGCATGEEAYSLSIAALEALPISQRPVEIWATDLSEAALNTARTGVYSGRALGNVTPSMLSGYFEPTGSAYRVRDRVRELVRFEQANLLEPLPAAARGLDIVFCQNVIIYFEPATSRAFLQQLHDVLPNGAMLCLGFSETLWNVFEGFSTREVLGAYVYYKETFVSKRTASLNPTMLQLRPNTPRRQYETRPLVESRSAPSNRTEERSYNKVQAIVSESTAVATLVIMAREHADRGQLERAVEAASKAVERDPLHEEAALLLGVLYDRQGQWDAAARQLERARYLNGASPLVSFHLAETYCHAAKIEAAKREYRNALVKLQSHPPDMILDGVTVGWLRETCRRKITQLSGNLKGR